MDPELLRATWTQVARDGDDPIRFFYGALFEARPALKDLFPNDMTQQRTKIAATIGLVVRAADNPANVLPRLQRLGRDHRRFGAIAEHFPVVKDVLLWTLEVYLGDGWTDEIAKTWTEALDLVAGVMIEAGRDLEDANRPAQWLAPVVDIQHHGPDEAWILLDPGPTFPFRPGHTVPIALDGEPGSERHYRPESYEDSTVLAIHVRRSTDPITLALLNRPGGHLRVGPPFEPGELA